MCRPYATSSLIYGHHRESGVGDHGRAGIQQFVERHQCSNMCIAMCLTSLENEVENDVRPRKSAKGQHEDGKVAVDSEEGSRVVRIGFTLLKPLSIVLIVFFIDTKASSQNFK